MTERLSLWEQKQSHGLFSVTGFQPLKVDEKPREVLGQSGAGEVWALSTPDPLPQARQAVGKEVPQLAEGFLSATGSGWPTAISTRPWSSLAAASCSPSPASNTSGSRADSRPSRWAGGS